MARKNNFNQQLILAILIGILLIVLIYFAFVRISSKSYSVENPLSNKEMGLKCDIICQSKGMERCYEMQKFKGITYYIDCMRINESGQIEHKDFNIWIVPN